MEYRIPYNRREYTVELPDRYKIKMIEPNKVPVCDARDIMREGFESPVNFPRLKEFLKNTESLLIIVNDQNRATPTAQILEYIYNDFKLYNVRFIIASGAHSLPTRADVKKIFGPFYNLYKDRIYLHYPKSKDALVYLGDSKFGTKIYLNKIVLDSQKIITINSVEPHYFAGYTGGRKSFVPGVAGFETIEANHRLALKPDSRVIKLKGNPVHEDMVDIASVIPEERIFSIQAVLDKDHKLYSIFTGNIHDSFYEATKKADEVFCVKIPCKYDIVVSVVLPPMDISLYQSQKALHHGRIALREGGIFILVSACISGIGMATFEELLQKHKDIREIAEKVKKEYKLGYHIIAKMTEMSIWAEMWAVCEMEKKILKKLLIKPFKSIQRSIEEAIKVKGKEAKILIILDGSVVVPLPHTI